MKSEIVEQDLPGIGRCFTAEVGGGATVMVVIHHTGRRELYVLRPGSHPEEADAVVTLSDDQARRLGSVLAGAYFKPAIVERVEEVIGGLLIDWATVRDDSPGAGRTIADLEIRRRTRMTVAALLRADGTSIIAPEPSETISGGDRLVVIGRPEDLEGFLRHVIG
jgi:TrkA domain protein